MKFSNERLSAIYDKTNGNCHLCFRKLSYGNYGHHGLKGAWHVEHSVPKAKGGTDHLHNLYAGCICCNHEKGVLHTKTIRRRNGVTRAPYSREKKERIKSENTLAGMIAGGIAGAGFGPLGIIGGAIAGGLFGESFSPRK